MTRVRHYSGFTIRERPLWSGPTMGDFMAALNAWKAAQPRIRSGDVAFITSQERVACNEALRDLWAASGYADPAISAAHDELREYFSTPMSPDDYASMHG